MVNSILRRREVLTGLTAAACLPNIAFANGYIDLDWSDLLPKGQTNIPNSIRSLLPHDETAPMSSRQPDSTGVRPDWNGQTVRLPGFIVPVDYSGSGVTAFILVPFVGACVHVPPPPANQLVFVSSEVPYETKGLYEPVHVIGQFSISSMSTHLAQVGYALTADSIEPFRL